MAPRQRIISPQSSTYDDAADSTQISQDRKARKGSTLNETEADIARDNHDYFNLGALVFIIITTAINYDVPVDGFGLTWTGEYFWTCWTTTLIYFFSDLVWVATVPICVKSPSVIIKHHIVAMIYLMGPVCYPEYSWFMGAILSVEINTWFLILRRVVFKMSPARPVSPLVGQIVSAMFYLTWILIRCIIYPGVLFQFLQLAAARIAETGSVWHPEMLFIPTHAVLCILNLKWTYDLFQPIVKRWLGVGPKIKVVQNGL